MLDISWGGVQYKVLNLLGEKRMKEKLKKCPWKVIVSVVVFVVTLALNIWLVCMPVFKGSPYRAKTEDGAVKITFYDTTYKIGTRESYECGFYVANKECVKMEGYSTGERKSVFLIESGKLNFYNAGAIVLQCFYGVVLIVSVVCIFGFSSEFIKSKNNKSNVSF